MCSELCFFRKQGYAYKPRLDPLSLVRMLLSVILTAANDLNNSDFCTHQPISFLYAAHFQSDRYVCTKMVTIRFAHTLCVAVQM